VFERAWRGGGKQGGGKGGEDGRQGGGKFECPFSCKCEQGVGQGSPGGGGGLDLNYITFRCNKQGDGVVCAMSNMCYCL
jgi:hypothetical protein